LVDSFGTYALGECVSGLEYHRGVGISVTAIGSGQWRWTIHPPTSVRGLEAKTGRLFGARADAIEAARREIESQDIAVN